jgi:hypothetical protein
MLLMNYIEVDRGHVLLDRFSQEGKEGLKNRPKSGRHQDISEEKIHR